MKAIEYKHLNYFLAGFFALQVLPVLFGLVHPLLFFCCTLFVGPATVVAAVVLLVKGDAMMRLLKYQVTLGLYVLAILCYGYLWHEWSVGGVLE